MNYCLHITSPPYSEQGAYTALNLAKALLKANHSISRIFFSGMGVLNANALSVAPQDELNLPKAWQTLANENSIEVIVCVASALKYGVIDESEALRYNKAHHNLCDGFILSGLGQLVEACLITDRVIKL